MRLARSCSQMRQAKFSFDRVLLAKQKRRVLIGKETEKLVFFER